LLHPGYEHGSECRITNSSNGEGNGLGWKLSKPWHDWNRENYDCRY
jgi:hypothetical protein